MTTEKFKRYEKEYNPWAVELPRDVIIPTREGEVEGKEGDMLMIDSDGGLYPCERGTFEDMYNEIE